jgi:hypothetical protein
MAAPQLGIDGLLVSQNNQRRPVTAFTPLAQAGGLEIWVLIDDGASENFGLQLADLRSFLTRTGRDHAHRYRVHAEWLSAGHAGGDDGS